MTQASFKAAAAISHFSRPLRVCLDLFLHYTPRDELQLIKSEGSSPKVVLLNGGYSSLFIVSIDKINEINVRTHLVKSRLKAMS